MKPQLNNEPPTIKALNSKFKPLCMQQNIEIYPQANRVIRLPIGNLQSCLDFRYHKLERWDEKLYWFSKLDEFDLSTIPYNQLIANLYTYEKNALPGILQEGKELLENGLQMPSSRNDSQFKVLYYLWRLNVPQIQAEQITFNWIKNNHNGFSKEITTYPNRVRKEILRQAAHIYSKYELSHTFPDSTHNNYNGFIAKPDIREIIEICKGSIPRITIIVIIFL